MGTPVDFWSLEDCVKVLSDLGESRGRRETNIDKVAADSVNRIGGGTVGRVEGNTSMSGYSSSEDSVRQQLAEAAWSADEKQRDLELAAQIGSRLLEQNKDLERRLEVLDAQLLSANDRAQQLRHELVQKEQLVQVYSSICEEAQGDELWSSHTSSHPSPQHQLSATGASPAADIYSPRSSRRGVLSTGLDQLQIQIALLEEENNRLRTEHEQLRASGGIKQEKTVVEDCLRQLSDANTYIRSLSEDLTKKTDKFMERQTEVTDLFSRAIDMERHVKQLTGDNAVLNDRLGEAQSSQTALTSQLVDLRDKYDQCLTMLSEAHNEIRLVQCQQKQQQQPPLTPSPMRTPVGAVGGPAASGVVMGATPALSAPAPAMTLAAELEESLLAEVEEDDEPLPNMAAVTVGGGHYLPTVASYSEMSTHSDITDLMAGPQHAIGGPAAAVLAGAALRRSSYPWDVRPGRSDLNSDSTSASSLSDDAQGEDEEEEQEAAAAAVAAMKRRRQAAGGGRRVGGGGRHNGRQHRTAKRLHQQQLQQQQQTASRWSPSVRIPAVQPLQDKVQMVKSMEGSTTLRQWQRLARPSMSGALFERRPGVRVRGCSGSRTSAGLGLGGLCSDSDPETDASQSEPRPRAGGVSFGLGGLGMEDATPEPSPPREPAPSKKKVEEEELSKEVETITFRMSSAPPDPSRTLDALNQRRAMAEKPSPLARPQPKAGAAPSRSVDRPGAVASGGAAAAGPASTRQDEAVPAAKLPSTNLAAILSQKGIRSKTYEQLVDEGFPVVPPPPPAPCPATPRNSPTAEMEERYSREQNAVPGPVNPTLVFAGLLESLSELFKPLSASTTSLRADSNIGGGLRRNFSAGSNLDGGLNLVGTIPAANVSSVVHRTDSSAASPRKK